MKRKTCFESTCDECGLVETYPEVMNAVLFPRWFTLARNGKKELELCSVKCVVFAAERLEKA